MTFLLQSTHKTFSCQVCSKVISLSNKSHHLKRCNKPPDVHSCQRCDFETLDKVLLTDHIKKAHPRFVCDHCGYRAPTQKRLNQHLNIHQKVVEFCLSYTYLLFTYSLTYSLAYSLTYSLAYTLTYS